MKFGLTEVGAHLLKSGVVRFTHVELGDGQRHIESGKPVAAKELVNMKLSLPIESYLVIDGKLMAKIRFNNAHIDEGFFWRESGVFGGYVGDEQKFLLAYSVAANQNLATFIPENSKCAMEFISHIPIAEVRL